MNLEWLLKPPQVYGLEVLLVMLVLGGLTYLITGRIARLAKHEFTVRTIRRFSLPLALLFLAMLIDDVLKEGGWEHKWWADETEAAFRSLPVLAWTWAFIATSSAYFSRLIEKHRAQNHHVGVLIIVNKVTTALFVVGGAMVLLRVWDLNLTPFIASAGLFTAVGAIFSKFAGGLFVYVERPYAVGDWVVLPTGERGQVMDIGLRSTRLRTQDDILIVMSNSVMAEGKIINETAPVPRFRLCCPLGVSYHSDLEAISAIILGVVTNNPLVLTDPIPTVQFKEFGEYCLKLELHLWIEDPADKNCVLDLVIRGIHQAFREAGLEFPSPHMEVEVQPKS